MASLQTCGPHNRQLCICGCQPCFSGGRHLQHRLDQEYCGSFRLRSQGRRQLSAVTL